MLLMSVENNQRDIIEQLNKYLVPVCVEFCMFCLYLCGFLLGSPVDWNVKMYV